MGYTDGGSMVDGIALSEKAFNNLPHLVTFQPAADLNDDAEDVANPFQPVETTLPQTQRPQALLQHLRRAQLQSLTHLEELGYVQLADTFKLNRGYPWNRILNVIAFPALAEQLTNLYLLSLQQNVKRNDLLKIMDFAITYAESISHHPENNEADQNEAILEAQKVLGLLTYLVNEDPVIALKCIVNNSEEMAAEKILETFDSIFVQVLASVKAEVDSHAKIDLQPMAIVSQIVLARTVAKVLITKTGFINFGLVEDLERVFLSHYKNINHFSTILYGLKVIQNSPSLREAFTRIHAPIAGNHVSPSIIRATLNLPLDTPITAREAQQTVLTSLLSHLRQNNDGACFATSVAIELMSSHLRHCFKDFVRLIQSGKITRLIKDVRKEFVPLLRINDDHIEKKLTINKQGFVLVNNQPKITLWDIPGIRAACEAVGIVDVKNVLLFVVSENFSKEPKKNTIELPIKHILRDISRLATKNLKVHLQQTLNPNQTMDGIRKVLHLFRKAEFAFSAQTNPPLPEAWKIVMATMAESNESSPIKVRFVNSVIHGFSRILTNAQVPSCPVIKSILHDVKSKLGFIKLQFDPSLTTITIDGENFKEGGFIPINMKRRIDSPAEFMNFIKTTFAEVIASHLSKNPSEEDKRKITNISQIINTHLQEKKVFISDVLKKFDDSNKVDDVIDKMEKGLLKITPWAIFVGNSPQNVLKVYLNSDFPTQPLSHTYPTLTGTTIKKCVGLIHIIQDMGEKERETYQRNATKRIQFLIPQHHTGSFIVGHPSLDQMRKTIDDPEEWIQQTLIAPIAQLRNQPMDAITKKNLLKKLEEKILPHYIKEKIPQFRTSVKQLDNEEYSICDYRDLLLELLLNFDPKLNDREKLTRFLDAALVESLEPQLKQKMDETTLHFADTNWRDKEGMNDNHLVFLVNPGTGELEVWEASSNNQHYHCLDQTHWLVAGNWEIFQISPDCIADDLAVE